MKGNKEQNVIDINSTLPVVDVDNCTDAVEALDHFWRKDFQEIKHLRHQLYIKLNQLAQYRHKPEAVQEAVYTMRNAMITVNEAQIEVDRANR